MNSTPIIVMFSGTGELARAVDDGLNEFTCFQSFSDNYGPARKYLKVRFPGAEVHKDFRDQTVPEGSIVTIGAPCQSLDAVGLSISAQRRLAGNAVVRLQARLMLQRGLSAINNERNL